MERLIVKKAISFLHNDCSKSSAARHKNSSAEITG